MREDLFRAFNDGEMEYLEDLIEARALDQQTCIELFHLAAGRERMELLHALDRVIPDINVQDADGHPALWNAFMEHAYAAMYWLLRRRANVDVLLRGIPLMCRAIDEEILYKNWIEDWTGYYRLEPSLQRMKILLRFQPDLTIRSTAEGYPKDTPVDCARRYGWTALLQLFEDYERSRADQP